MNQIDNVSRDPYFLYHWPEFIPFATVEGFAAVDQAQLVVTLNSYASSIICRSYNICSIVTLEQSPFIPLGFPTKQIV